MLLQPITHRVRAAAAHHTQGACCCSPSHTGCVLLQPITHRVRAAAAHHAQGACCCSPSHAWIVDQFAYLIEPLASSNHPQAILVHWLLMCACGIAFTIMYCSFFKDSTTPALPPRQCPVLHVAVMSESPDAYPVCPAYTQQGRDEGGRRQRRQVHCT